MTQINDDQIRACYDAAKDVHNGKSRPTDANREATQVTGMNASTARDVVFIVRSMLRGRRYTRTLPAQSTQLTLNWIMEDFGDAMAKTAAQTVLKHVDYFADLPRGGRQPAVREVADKFLSGLVLPELETLIAQENADLADALARTSEDRAARLAAADPVPRTTIVTTTVFRRNLDVVATVLLRAKGVCEACKMPAPFLRFSNGNPYLEVHHRIFLAEHGLDMVENAIALCPNCHREAHHGVEQEKFRT